MEKEKIKHIFDIIADEAEKAKKVIINKAKKDDIKDLENILKSYINKKGLKKIAKEIIKNDDKLLYSNNFIIYFIDYKMGKIRS